MREFASVYSSIDPWLSSQLASGYDFLRVGVSIAPVFFRNHESITQNYDWVKRELSEYFFTGCVGVYDEKVVGKYGPPIVACPLMAEESSGKMRLIWNAKPVNVGDRDGHVKYESMSGILPFLTPDVLCFKTDMRTGYFQLPMREQDAPFLCFIFDGVIYYWKVLPFGLHSAPRFFERCTQPLKTHMRLHFKLLCLIYLDDLLFATLKCRILASDLRFSILSHITSFGWVLARPKTTELSLVTEVVGLCIDTHTCTVSVSSSRENKFLSLLSTLSSLAPNACVCARTLARFAGYLVSMVLRARGTPSACRIPSSTP